jgi:hypothetical protein
LAAFENKVTRRPPNASEKLTLLSYSPKRPKNLGDVTVDLTCGADPRSKTRGTGRGLVLAVASTVNALVDQ